MPQLPTLRAPQTEECKKLLESKGAKPGDAPFNPAYLTTEAVACFTRVRATGVDGARRRAKQVV